MFKNHLLTSIDSPDSEGADRVLFHSSSMGVGMPLSIWCLYLSLYTCSSSYWSAMSIRSIYHTGQLKSHVLNLAVVSSLSHCIVVCSRLEPCIAASVTNSKLRNKVNCWMFSRRPTPGVDEEFQTVFLKLGVDIRHVFREDNECSCSLPANKTHEKFLYITQYAHKHTKLYVYKPRVQQFVTLVKVNKLGKYVAAIVPDSVHCKVFWLERLSVNMKELFSSCLDGTKHNRLIKGPLMAFGVEKRTGVLFYTVRENHKTTTKILFPNSQTETLHEHSPYFKGNCFAVDEERRTLYWCESRPNTRHYTLKTIRYDSDTQSPTNVVIITSQKTPRVCVPDNGDIYWTTSGRKLVHYKQGKGVQLAECPRQATASAYGCILSPDNTPFLACYIQPRYTVHMYKNTYEIGHKDLPVKSGAILNVG